MLVTRVTNVAPVQGRVTSALLRVIDGPDRGMEIELPPIGVVVGTERSCDVVLTDTFVSRRHCSIAPHAQGFSIGDLGSKNATLIDGVAVGKVVAPPGVVVRVGKTLIQVVPADEVVDIPPSASDRFGEMYGTSPAMRQVFAILERASKSTAPVLLLGESGTGKELAARAIHDASPRADKPFVVFDCGAGSEHLIESDLFGHVKGAFTGATTDRVGAFAAAHGGTLFLDEIGDLPVGLQPKLLRMLEAGEVVSLGGRKTEKYDVRIVAATHRDVHGEVARGGFRGDLYYRLAVVEVHLPPLRQRGGDLPVLIQRFLERAGSKLVASGDALAKLTRYHWPGNVRELRNVIARAVALAGPEDDFASLPLVFRPTGAAPDDAGSDAAIVADRPFHEMKDEHVAKFERAYLTDLVARAQGNLSEAARMAGLERKFLYKLLERNGLR